MVCYLLHLVSNKIICVFFSYIWPCVCGGKEFDNNNLKSIRYLASESPEASVSQRD